VQESAQSSQVDREENRRQQEDEGEHEMRRAALAAIRSEFPAAIAQAEYDPGPRTVEVEGPAGKKYETEKERPAWGRNPQRVESGGQCGPFEGSADPAPVPTTLCRE
jgi:hypothetical protein